MDSLGEGADNDKRKTTKESEAKYNFSMTHGATVCSLAALSRFRTSQFEASSGASINKSLFISANNFVSHAERNCLQCSLRFANGIPAISESPRNDSMVDNDIVSTLQQFTDFLLLIYSHRTHIRRIFILSQSWIAEPPGPGIICSLFFTAYRGCFFHALLFREALESTVNTWQRQAAGYRYGPPDPAVPFPMPIDVEALLLAT